MRGDLDSRPRSITDAGHSMPRTLDTGHPETLVDVLRMRARDSRDGLAAVFLDTQADEVERATYGELDRRARAVAAAVRAVAPDGARVVVLCPPGIDYIAAFFGCLYAGTVAVPVYPAVAKRELPRLHGILVSSGAAAVVTTRALADLLVGAVPAEAIVVAEDCGPGDAGDDGPVASPAPDALAFLQYTSGSTRSPKGVMISHRSAVANQRTVAAAFGHRPGHTVMGSWLPLYHDMGLGAVFQAFYLGTVIYFMSPFHFLKRPAAWLKAISRYGITTSGGPSFAYEMCARRIKPQDREGLDLSRWEVAFNGAEPVRAEVLDLFAETFAAAGFRRDAFYPCYGLAESVLFVAGGDPQRAPTLCHVDRAALERRTVHPVAPGAADARTLVGCGWSGPDHQVVLVDPERGVPAADGEVGEIWFAGPSVASGYWDEPDETGRTFGATLPGDPGRFLRTGDLGFRHDGHLFVVGRLKDLIIVRGRNHYPEDLERTIEQSHAALRPSSCAAFAVEAEGEERIVVVQEIRTDRDPELDLGVVLADIREAVTRDHGVALYDALLVAPGTVPKTSSGKVRRSACRARFLEGAIEPLGALR